MSTSRVSTSFGDRRSLLLDAAARAGAYLDQIERRPVAPSPAAVAALARLGGPLPEAPQDSAAVLALLDEVGSPATVVNAGGRFFGFVNGGAVEASLAANVLAAAWDQNASLRVMSPVGAALEDIAIEWLIDLFGLPAGCGAGFVTGATMANFTCLAAARHAVLSDAGWDVEARGLFGAPPITVVIGDEAHVSLRKALALLGLGRDRVSVVPVDGQGRMRANRLPKFSGPTIVCAQAGNVNSGAFDPIGDICRAAREAGAWVHVDGAFGLWAVCSPARAHATGGFAAADSWATDAHKWLNVPYDSGLAFVRAPEYLRAAMSVQAAYLQPGETREPMYFTPECSRRARGIEVWAALRSLGRQGLADMIDRACRHASRFADGLQAAGYRVLNEIVINQVLVSFGERDVTERVIRAIQQDGVCWCGGTVWQGQAAMRISVSSWATTNDDVERSLAAILRAAEQARQFPQTL
jgi:glutamate/tyrosine decarboxylase-like PLP-dependent enzyme